MFVFPLSSNMWQGKAYGLACVLLISEIDGKVMGLAEEQRVN